MGLTCAALSIGRSYIENHELVQCMTDGEPSILPLNAYPTNTQSYNMPVTSNLIDVNPLVETPHSLEVVLHPLPQFLGDLVDSEEILEVPPFGLVQ